MRSEAFPLYVGGFLGPFGGSVVPVLIPELRHAFDASTSDVALSVPAYLLPFAVVLLVSGTIGERLGRRRVVRTAYVVYAIAMFGAAAAPNILAFDGFRALQGIANAFTTPLLLAGLADAVPPTALGRSVGTFAGIQAGGVSFAPLIGGLCAEVSWRLAFIAPGLVALALVTVPPREGAGMTAGTARLRDLVTGRMALLCAMAFAGYAGMTGLAFLVAVRAADSFELGAAARGLLVAAYGAAGLVLGRAAGRAVDRFGPLTGGAAGALLSALAVAPIGFSRSVLVVTALWTLAGGASALLWGGLNTASMDVVPHNRSGAVSVFSAFKFVGSAAAPLLWLPVYNRSPGAAFLCAAALTLTILPTARLLGRKPVGAAPARE